MTAKATKFNLDTIIVSVITYVFKFSFKDFTRYKYFLTQYRTLIQTSGS